MSIGKVPGSHSIDNNRQREDVVYNNLSPRGLVAAEIFSTMKTRLYIVPNLFLTLSIKWRIKLTKEFSRNYWSQWAIVKYPPRF